ncbi:unnamed protein product [Coffea canephora]|uniref:Glycosyltransferase 61 catalytic domain-containing protein n=1 Tax=Coffea canephora TaxID=49390 RepID=A0A068UZ46_COFCA|nr:unnamed protein product [Coffea canephora]
MEESKKQACSLSSFLISLLIILPLVYSAFFQLDQWKANLANWNSNLGFENKLDEGAPEQEPLKFLLRRLLRGEQRIQFEDTGFAYPSELHSDIYVSSKQVRFDTNSSKIYIHANQAAAIHIVRPHALKGDEAPIQHFGSHVIFMVTDFQHWFFNKYKKIFSQLPSYEAINAAETANGTVHCFPGAVIGLKYHDNLYLNRSDVPGGYSMFEFRDFLVKSFDFNIKNVSQLIEEEKPKLLLLSRAKTRKILNQVEVVKLMEQLGFRVVPATLDMMMNFEEFAHVVNNCSVIVGVHGAGLTNELFLPNGAVVIQVVPLGLDWPGNACFGGPAVDMGLQYLEYKIEPQESSLYDLYAPNHPVIADPESMKAQGYQAFRAIYIDKQDVKINVERFRKTLVETMRLLGRPTNPLP